MVTTCEETVTGSCRHGGKHTGGVCLSPLNATAQIGVPCIWHVKSDLVKEISTLKHRKGNQGLPLTTGRQSGRKGERSRGECSCKNIPEHPRDPRAFRGGKGREGHVPQSGLVRHMLGRGKHRDLQDIPEVGTGF